jgi:hypothetical protein
MLVRKPGYLNRRIEVYVNINGCILCVDGMGIKEPDKAFMPIILPGKDMAKPNC